MQKLRVRLPATIRGIGAAQVSLALKLYTTVEFIERSGTSLDVAVSGEGSALHEIGIKHPVVRAMSRFFQSLERAHLGVQITINNDIPVTLGLGADTAFAVAGVMGANALLQSPYDREDIIDMVAQWVAPSALVASLSGGMGAAAHVGGTVLYRALPVAVHHLILISPDDASDRPTSASETTAPEVVRSDLERSPLIIDALKSGDLERLTLLTRDTLESDFGKAIPHVEIIQTLAERSGAIGIVPLRNSPAILILASERHDQISDDIVVGLKSAGVDARSWVVPVDTQGIVISAMQTA